MVLARAAVIALLVLASTRTTAADEATIRLLKAWVDAVHVHVPGEVDAPLGSIATLNREDLIRLRPYVSALVGLVPNAAPVRATRLQIPNADVDDVRLMAALAPNGRSPNEFVKRAALLHTDVVLLVHSYPTLHPAIQPRPRQPRREGQGEPLEVPLVIARGPDGRYDGLELGNLNWDYARDLLDAVTPLPIE